MRFCVLMILVLCNIQLIAQNRFSAEDRKGQLFFNVSSEYRVASLFDQDITTINAVDLQDQTTGLAFNYAFDWFTGRKISFGFSHSLRYDHILKATLDPNQIGISSAVDTNGLLMDFHFYAQLYFNVFEKAETYFLLGRSLLNVGSDYNDVRRFFDEGGSLIATRSMSTNTNYGSWNGGIGLKIDRYSVLVGLYFGDNVNYFQESGILSIPYVRLSYNIGRL